MVSYTITACTEDMELQCLLWFLKDKITEYDEIVIQIDTMSVTSKVRHVIDMYRNKISNLNVVEFQLDNDFSQFKNNLKNHCSKEWIFNIDADEIPSAILVHTLHAILKNNPDTDVISVPRWNTVNGITDNHILKWNWMYDEYKRINWPDYQMRIYKNLDNILWTNKVHERIIGFDSHSILPALEEYCLYHHKSIEKQEMQNDFYDKIN
jgi:hypothetical protein